MAKPIKETPILRGRDAEVFNEQMKQSAERKMTAEEKKKIRNSYERIKAIAKF